MPPTATAYSSENEPEAKPHMLAPVGRWSTEKDRASFVQGYRQGLDSNERD